jgi:hypothetical protein
LTTKPNTLAIERRQGGFAIVVDVMDGLTSLAEAENARDWATPVTALRAANMMCICENLRRGIEGS